MSWVFERVAGPFPSPLGGVVPSRDGVLFASIADSRILSYVAEANAVAPYRRFTSRANGLARGPDGSLYAGQEASRRVVQLHDDGSTTVTAVTLEGRYHNHPADVAVDSKGRVWFTDAHHPLPAFGPQIYPPLPFASVLRLERGPNHRWLLKRMSFDSSHPGALALSADESTLFVSERGLRPDSARELRAHPVLDDDTLGEPIVCLSFGADGRGPHRGIEGLCIAADGRVVACGGWRRSGPGPCIYVLSPAGHLLEAHPFPDDRPARCTFAGPGSRSLYVTTETGHLWRAQDPGRSSQETT